ncbi:D-beta-hydroxybutyrate dehydrogenase, mitochondrial-like isoform X1 [Antedon mediterranea]|uniref:D-beta-hydroxybutyrate dehydrogenase, mitochondrial-like isoform X1 n=1 Tax=Antedon mediterranea TaxID=105859 RepID=UPI003AF979E9
MMFCLILGYCCFIVTEYIVAIVLMIVGIYVGSKALPRGRLSPSNKAVFITGCDTGFGHSLALRLDQLGYLVYAGCLFPDRENARLLSTSSTTNRLTIVACDITSEESVLSAKETIQKSLPKGFCLWAIVNNAGVWTYGEIEITQMETIKRIAEVNVYGTIRVTKAFLPIIRRCKGRVVNVGSLGGRISAIPGGGAYCMTKYAIECFNDTLRYEMSPWGVKVCLIEPGQYGKSTNIGINNIENISEEIWKNVPEDVKEDYGKEHQDGITNIYKKGREYCYGAATPVVNSMVDSITSRTPRHRYLVGGLIMTYLQVYAMELIPSWLGDHQYIGIMNYMVPLPAYLKRYINK